MQQTKHKKIIYITIIFIQIFIIYTFSISNINFTSKAEINKNITLLPKDFICQNGKYIDNKFYIEENDIKDNTQITLFTYGIREKVIAGIYQINIQYNTNNDNNYIEITYFDKNNKIVNKEILNLQSEFNNIAENITINKNIDNIDIKTYYGNIGELELSKINLKLISETKEYNKILILTCIFLIFDILLFLTLLIINKVKKRKNTNNEILIEKKELSQIDNSTSTIDEIDNFFNEWMNLNNSLNDKSNNIKEKDDFYSSIVEHQIEDFVNLNNNENQDSYHFNMKSNNKQEDFDFRYTEEDFAMTEDYKKGYVE